MMARSVGISTFLPPTPAFESEIKIRREDGPNKLVLEDKHVLYRPSL